GRRGTAPARLGRSSRELLHGTAAARSLAMNSPTARRAATIASRPGARRLRPKPALVHLAIAALAVLLIASPLLFSSDGFGPEAVPLMPRRSGPPSSPVPEAGMPRAHTNPRD